MNDAPEVLERVGTPRIIETDKISQLATTPVIAPFVSPLFPSLDEALWFVKEELARRRHRDIMSSMPVIGKGAVGIEL